MAGATHDEEEGGGGEAPARKKFSGKKLVLFIILPLLLILGGAAAAFLPVCSPQRKPRRRKTLMPRRSPTRTANPTPMPSPTPTAPKPRAVAVTATRCRRGVLQSSRHGGQPEQHRPPPQFPQDQPQRGGRTGRGSSRDRKVMPLTSSIIFRSICGNSAWRICAVRPACTGCARNFCCAWASRCSRCR